MEILFFLYSLYAFLKNKNEKNKIRLIKHIKKSGPLGIKLVQFILMRDDFVDDQLSFVFENCEKHSFEDTRKLYFKDFQKDIYDDFEIEDLLPIASGSIGQVYKLKSKLTGEYLAMKVKHPDMNKKVNQFTKLIKILCWLVYPFNKYHSMIMEYLGNIKTQLDYKQEAQNTILLKEKWKNEETVIVPTIYDFTENFIIMSYHEGQNFYELSKERQLNVSLYMNFIFLTSLLVHDFVHADLHIGNWKVIGDKILLYDCGIMCSTGDLEYNKKIVDVIFSGNYENALDFICTKKTKQFEKCKLFLKTHLPDNSADRLKVFINKVLEMRLPTNKESVCILNAFALIGEIYKSSSSLFTKYVGTQNKCCEIPIYMYIGLLSKIGSFSELREFLNIWMNSESFHKQIYEDWLMDSFGHKKMYILDNIISSKFNLKKLA